MITKWTRRMRTTLRAIDALKLLDLKYLRPLESGLVPDSHPWVTGIHPDTLLPTYVENVVFSTKPETDATGNDEMIAEHLWRMLGDQISEVAESQEFPFGRHHSKQVTDQYFFGCIRFSAGIVIFNNAKEAANLVNQARFRREMKRFCKETSRDLLFVFREKQLEQKSIDMISGLLVRNMRYHVLFPDLDRCRYPVLIISAGHTSRLLSLLRMREKEVHVLERMIPPAIPRKRYFTQDFSVEPMRTMRLPFEKRLSDSQRASASHALELETETLGRVAQLAKPLFSFHAKTVVPNITSATTTIVENRLDVHHKELIQIAIIGGGVNGLSLAAQLKAKGLRPVIIEASERLADSYRKLPNNFRLPFKANRLRLPYFPKKSIGRRKDFLAGQFGQVLEQYAKDQDLTVLNPFRVSSIRKNAFGLFELKSQSGDHLVADQVVLAIGPSKINEFLDLWKKSLPDVPVLEANEYRSPQHLQETLKLRDMAKILVVGADHRALHIIYELERSNYRVLTDQMGPESYPQYPIYGDRIETLYEEGRVHRVPLELARPSLDLIQKHYKIDVVILALSRVVDLPECIDFSHDLESTGFHTAEYGQSFEEWIDFVEIEKQTKVIAERIESTLQDQSRRVITQVDFPVHVMNASEHLRSGKLDVASMLNPSDRTVWFALGAYSQKLTLGIGSVAYEFSLHKDQVRKLSGLSDVNADIVLSLESDDNSAISPKVLEALSDDYISFVQNEEVDSALDREMELTKKWMEMLNKMQFYPKYEVDFSKFKHVGDCVSALIKDGILDGSSSPLDLQVYLAHPCDLSDYFHIFNVEYRASERQIMHSSFVHRGLRIAKDTTERVLEVSNKKLRASR